MALEDVTEVWTRPKRRKIPALGKSPPNFTKKQNSFYFNILENAIASFTLKPPKIQPPEIKITPCADKKLEQCERHVKQLLLRGEHVALVVVYSENIEKPK